MEAMKRRSFLGALVAGFTLDPERLLWQRERKMISIPAPGIKVVREPLGVYDQDAQDKLVTH